MQFHQGDVIYIGIFFAERGVIYLLEELCETDLVLIALELHCLKKVLSLNLDSPICLLTPSLLFLRHNTAWIFSKLKREEVCIG